MARPKNPQEAEIVDRLERAALRARDRVRGQRFGGEGRGARIGDGVGRREAAEPIADPVGVPGPYNNANTALDDSREGGEEVAGVWLGVYDLARGSFCGGWESFGKGKRESG